MVVGVDGGGVLGLGRGVVVGGVGVGVDFGVVVGVVSKKV